MACEFERLKSLTSAFEKFYSTLDATTVPDADGGRRVGGIPHAVALSEVTVKLYTEIKESLDRLAQDHAKPVAGLPSCITILGSDSPDGPWTNLPADAIRVSEMAIGSGGASAVLLAALEDAAKVAGFPADKWNAMQAVSPGGNHQRWRVGEVIGREQLLTLESARKLLQLCVSEAGDGNENRTANDKPGGSIMDSPKLVGLLDLIIVRLDAQPNLINDKIWDCAEGLRVSEINAAAAQLGLGPIFDACESANSRSLTTYHPTGIESRVQRSSHGFWDKRLDVAAKEIVVCLKAWRSEALAANRPQEIRKRGGRRKATYETVQREAKLAADWERARESKVYKPVFAKEKGTTEKELDKLLDRVAKRKRDSE
jgi:hypothetical protein